MLCVSDAIPNVISYEMKKRGELVSGGQWVV
jgi:hypothetical protein